MRGPRSTTAPRRVRDRPKTAEAGAEAIRQAAVKLFERHDGEAVDWTLMAESLFRAAFHCLDKSPNPDRRSIILRLAEVGVYQRLSGNIPAAPPLPEIAAALPAGPPVVPAPEPGFHH